MLDYEMLAQSYEHPEVILDNGYRLFFNGYIPSDHDDSLVGYCLGWRTKDDKLYFSVCGLPITAEYQKGKPLLKNVKRGDLPTRTSTSIAELRGYKDGAMARLAAMVIQIV